MRTFADVFRICGANHMTAPSTDAVAVGTDSIWLKLSLTTASLLDATLLLPLVNAVILRLLLCDVKVAADPSALLPTCRRVLTSPTTMTLRSR